MQEKQKNDLPLYRQIEKYIMDCIHDSRYQQGMLIPSEEEFRQMFHTSRMTVHKAVNNLVARGVLHSIKGKGTFVNKFDIEKTMNSVTGWKQTMKAAGFRTRTEVLRFVREPSGETTAKHLNLPPGGDVYTLERLRYADDAPVVIEIAHLNAVFFQDFLENDFAENSLYETMEEKYGIQLNHVYQKLRTERIYGQYARLLFQKEEDTAMVMENTSYDVYTRPIEYTTSYINGERYSLRYVVNKYQVGQ